MFAWLDEHHVTERTPDMTDEQFHHNTQMHALAPFKAAAWNLPMDVKEQLSSGVGSAVRYAVRRLGCANTRQYVEQVIHPIKITPSLVDYLAANSTHEQIKGLAG